MLCNILRPSKRANIYPGNRCASRRPPLLPSSRGASVAIPQDVRFSTARSSWRGLVRTAYHDKKGFIFHSKNRGNRSNGVSLPTSTHQTEEFCASVVHVFGFNCLGYLKAKLPH